MIKLYNKIKIAKIVFNKTNKKKQTKIVIQKKIYKIYTCLHQDYGKLKYLH